MKELYKEGHIYATADMRYLIIRIYSINEDDTIHALVRVISNNRGSTGTGNLDWMWATHDTHVGEINKLGRKLLGLI